MLEERKEAEEITQANQIVEFMGGTKEAPLRLLGITKMSMEGDLMVYAEDYCIYKTDGLIDVKN